MDRNSGAETRLRVHVGGGDHDTLGPDRKAAALEVVAGYTNALKRLHGDDVAARAWYSARLADARTIAGLPAVALAPREPVQQLARP